MDVLILKSMGACLDAVKWAASQQNLYSAWRSCRADRLLWIAAKLGIDRKLIVAAACSCAESVLYLIPPEEERPRQAIEMTRKWIDGKASMAQVSNASLTALSAWAECDAIPIAHAYYAAYAAAYAAAKTIDCVDEAAQVIIASNHHKTNMDSLVRKRIPYQTMKRKWELWYENERTDDDERSDRND